MEKLKLLKKNAKNNTSFKCEICEKLFTRAYGLRRHIETIHDCSVYQCHRCLQIYTRAYRLEAHQKSECTPRIGNNNIVKITRIEDWLQEVNQLPDQTSQKINHDVLDKDKTASPKLKQAIPPRSHQEWTRRVPVDRGHNTQSTTPLKMEPSR